MLMWVTKVTFYFTFVDKSTKYVVTDETGNDRPIVTMLPKITIIYYQYDIFLVDIDHVEFK